LPKSQSTDLSQADWDEIDRQTKDEYLKLMAEADSLLSECHRRTCVHSEARRKLAFKEISREVVPV